MRALGEAWQSMGDIDRAVQFYQQAFAEVSKVGEVSTARAELFHRIGDVFISVSKQSQAIACYRRGIADYTALGNSHAADMLAARLQALLKK